MEASKDGLFTFVDIKLPFGVSINNDTQAFVRDDSLYLYYSLSSNVTILSLDPLVQKIGTIKTKPAKNLCVDSERNIWAVDCEFSRDDYGIEHANITMYKYDYTGSLIYSYDLNFLYETYHCYPEKILVDDEDNLFILASEIYSNRIFILNTDRDVINEQSIICDFAISHRCDIALFSTGKVIVGDSSNSGYELKLIDTKNKKWGESWSLANAFRWIHSGKDERLFLDDGTNLYEYDTVNGNLTLRANCILSGMSSIGSFIAELNSGQYLVLRLDYIDYINTTNVLTVLDNRVTTEKTPVILKLATMYDNYLRNSVLLFNSKNKDVKIDIVDYSIYNSYYGDSTGTIRMVTDIITGNALDIYDLSTMPVDKFITKKMLVDLYEFMDNDSEIDRNDYLENILSACENDGKLYELIPWYYIVTVAGRTKDVGEGIGWTFNEFKQVVDSMPDKRPFGTNLTRYKFLEYALFLNNSEFIDWSVGKCHFESDYFIDTLKFASTLPSTSLGDAWNYGSEDIFNGKQIFIFEDINIINTVNTIHSLFQDDITFKGFPASEGSGNVIATYLSLGISSGSKYKDEAWSFLKEFITENYQNTVPLSYAMLPIMTSSLDKIMAAHRNEVSAWGGQLYIDGFLLQTYKDPDYDISKAYELIKSTDRVMHTDLDLLNIVFEEAEAFFASDKSAEETARIIQSKALIYVNEQR